MPEQMLDEEARALWSHLLSPQGKVPQEFGWGKGGTVDTLNAAQLGSSCLCQEPSLATYWMEVSGGSVPLQV